MNVNKYDINYMNVDKDLWYLNIVTHKMTVISNIINNSNYMHNTKRVPNTNKHNYLTLHTFIYHFNQTLTNTNTLLYPYTTPSNFTSINTYMVSRKNLKLL